MGTTIITNPSRDDSATAFLEFENGKHPLEMIKEMIEREIHKQTIRSFILR